MASPLCKGATVDQNDICPAELIRRGISNAAQHNCDQYTFMVLCGCANICLVGMSIFVLILWIIIRALNALVFNRP